MKSVFADTLYWVAVVRPDDQWHAASQQAKKTLGAARLVTTDEVLSEFLTALSRGGQILRSRASRWCRRSWRIQTSRFSRSRALPFLAGLDLYQRRPDKTYSLVDCASMESMRTSNLVEILTNDDHFLQEGFTVLIKA